MAGIVLDTSVYISAIRSGDAGILDLRRASRMGAESSQPLWLSAVVLSELLIGVVDKTARRRLMEWKEFIRANRLLVPQQSDWRLLTKNPQDFELIARFRPFKWEQI